MNIEIKSRNYSNIKIVEKVIKLIHKYKIEKAIVISSFNDENLSDFKKPNQSVVSILDKNQVYIFQPNANSISAYKKINFFKLDKRKRFRLWGNED